MEKQMVKTMRRILMVLGTLMLCKVVGDAFLVVASLMKGRGQSSWEFFWGWGLPHFGDAMLCYVLAWIVGRLGKDIKEEEE